MTMDPQEEIRALHKLIESLNAALDAAEARERAAYEKAVQTLSDHAEGQEALLAAAREAGDDEDATYHSAAHNALMMALVSISELSDTDALAEYAEKVRAEERERCAMIAEAQMLLDFMVPDSELVIGAKKMRDVIASAIRENK
jgi:hypothetical protein